MSVTEDTKLRERVAAAQALIDRQELIAVASDLVRIPSVHDPARSDGNERAAASYVAALLRRWGIAYREREVAPGRPNIVADIAGARQGSILVFEGHTDVVTAGDASAWSFDPFSGDVRDGKLLGRGATDMKGGLAAMLVAARAIQRAGSDFAGTLRLAVLADEEGLMLGAKGFVADGELRGVTAVVSCEPESDRLCLAQKGAIRLRVRLTGKMAHGCMPHEGVNPVAALGEVLVACAELERAVQSEHPRHALLGTFYLTPTVALAGERAQGNVIPGSAELLLDIRTTPQHDHAMIHERAGRAIAAAVARVPGASYAIDVLDDRPATETEPDDPIVTAVSEAHRREVGTAPAFGGVPGTTDGTIFWAATRVPLVAFGPGIVTLAHQADEFVCVDDLVRYARVYVDAALSYFDALERG
jgi:succinyl-diaminopimelate desuccinylase